MTVRKPLTIYNPMHKSARVIAALLTAIETALENDGASIGPGLDRHGRDDDRRRRHAVPPRDPRRVAALSLAGGL